MLHIKNIRIIDNTQDFIGEILCKNGKITEIQKNSEKKSPFVKGDLEGFTEIDGTNLILMPGFFDPHVHFRDPGLTYKEDFITGSKAALSAGVTTIFDMPNTIPATFTVEKLAEKKLIAQEKSHVNWGLYFGAGQGNLEEIKKAENIPGIKLYLNTTTGNLKMDDENSWREIYRLGKKVSLHAEGETFFRAVDIWVEEGFPCEIHLCHASLASEIKKIKDVRKKFPEISEKITVEVCPHHLFLTDKERLKYGAYCCMKPELATQEDINYMWKSVSDGSINFFATDHAPHTKEEKDTAINPEISGPFGVPGVETFLPLLFTAFQEKNISLSRLAEMTSTNTVETFHISDKKGQIKSGFDADFVLLDPHFIGKINPENFHSKSKWSPFAKWDIRVRVEKSIISGNVVYDKIDKFSEKKSGKEIQFRSSLIFS